METILTIGQCAGLNSVVTEEMLEDALKDIQSKLPLKGEFGQPNRPFGQRAKEHITRWKTVDEERVCLDVVAAERVGDSLAVEYQIRDTFIDRIDRLGDYHFSLRRTTNFNKGEYVSGSFNAIAFDLKPFGKAAKPFRKLYGKIGGKFSDGTIFEEHIALSIVRHIEKYGPIPGEKELVSPDINPEFLVSRYEAIDLDECSHYITAANIIDGDLYLDFNPNQGYEDLFIADKVWNFGHRAYTRKYIDESGKLRTVEGSFNLITFDYVLGKVPVGLTESIVEVLKEKADHTIARGIHSNSDVTVEQIEK